MSAPMPSLYPKRGWWYLALTVNGKRTQVATGYRDRAGAEAFARDYLAKQAADPGGVVTLRAYGERWLREREDRGMRSVANYRSNLRLHVFSVLGDKAVSEIATRDVRALVRTLQGKQSRFGRPLASRTVRHVYDALKSVLESAHADELITTTPWVVLRSDLPPARDADPDWREGAFYTREECTTLISDERIPEDRRVFYALLWLAGLRFGEASALRWSDYDREKGRLSVGRSYATARAVIGPTKTGTKRLVPVHPVLASVLAQAEKRGDLISPSEAGGCRRSDRTWQTFREDLRAVSIPKGTRTMHNLRRTFVTMLRSEGAQTDLVRWIVHGPTTKVIDGYTSTPWPALVEAIKRLQAALPSGKVVKLRGRRA